MVRDEVIPPYVFKNGTSITDENLAAKMWAIVEKAPEKPYQENDTPYTWDEDGMADLFSELYKNDTRFCAATKSWYTYDGTRWRKDLEGILVSEKIKEFAALMRLYCAEIEDEQVKAKYFTFIKGMGDRRWRDRMMKDARGKLGISAEEFDAHPNLINCKNGTFDLSDGSFREHDWRDFLTMITNFDYTVQDVDCPRWRQFITEVTCDGGKENKPNPGKADYLQRALGYTILGSSKEECMFILHGSTTRNGKSTLLDAVNHLLGDYSTVAPVGIICKRYNDESAEAASPVLADLKGRRMVTMSENDSGSRLNESTLKQYTGGEPITARALYCSPITYTPLFTMWLSCNDLPAVHDDSLFASDRIRLIEFKRHFSNAEQDKDLKDYFKTQKAMEGIFHWLVEGYFRYKKYGLAMPEEMQKATKVYADDNDLALQFLMEKCETCDEGGSKGKALYDAYKIWCKSNGFYVCNAKRFYAGIGKHPDWYKDKRKSNGQTVYDGLKLKG